MKRILTILLASVMVLALFAGCGGSKEPSGTDDSALGTTPVTITFWHSFSDDAGVLMDEIVKDFNEGVGKDLQITVEAIYQGAYSDASTKMNSVLTSNQIENLPDVMNLDATGKINYNNSGVAYTLTEALADDPDYDISQILPAALSNWEYAGEQLGMPFATSTTIMYYNKTMLDEAGITSPPTTFAEITAMAEALPEKNAAGSDVIAFQGLPSTPTLANWIGQLGSYVVDNNNGADGTATKLVCVENGALKTFLTEWKAMYDAGALQNVEADTDAFVAGQVAVFNSSSSNIATLLDKIGDSFELGVANYPRVNADASYGATVSGSCMVMFDKEDALKKAAAWEFVQYLASADVQAKFAAGTGYIPANLGSADVQVYKDLIAEYPQYQVPVDQLNATPESMRSVTVGPSIDFYYAIQNNISDMLKNNTPVDQVVTEMEEELNDLLEQYNMSNPS